MTLDYEGSMKRIIDERINLAGQLWPDFMHFYKGSAPVSEEQIINTIIYNTGLESSEKNKRKLIMLDDLYNEKYWHLTDLWPGVVQDMPEGDISFYASLAIEQARRSSQNGELGYFWIALEGMGKLRSFVDGALMDEAVNAGFWEFANKYLTDSGVNPPWQRYEALMEQSRLLDLTRFSEFKKEPLRAYRNGLWPEEKYIECFERARARLSSEDAAWLACPIIENLIYFAFDSDETNDSRKFLEDELQVYRDYIDTQIIQDLFAEKIKLNIECIDGEFYYDHIYAASVLKEYLRLTDNEFKELASSSLYASVTRIVNSDIPREWLTDKKLAEIESEIKDYVNRCWGTEKEIVPNLQFMQTAVQNGLLDRDFAITEIRKSLEKYVRQKRVAAASKTQCIKYLDKSLVDPLLYKAVIKKQKEGELKRKEAKDARDAEWRRKLESL
jgi:hypothetical protein